MFLDGTGISRRVKLNYTVCLSTQEAEYSAQTEGVKDPLKVRMLLKELGFGQAAPTPLFCDNKGSLTMSLHPANKPATRHMDMRRHFRRQHAELGNVKPRFKLLPRWSPTSCLSKLRAVFTTSISTNLSVFRARLFLWLQFSILSNDWSLFGRG